MGSNRRRSVKSRNGKRQAVLEKPPALVEPGVYSSKEKANVYQAVDYMGKRFHVGEHVAVNTGGGGEEWVAVIESLFICGERQEPSFRGRWFWAPAHVRHHNSGKDKALRESRCEPFELIIADNRDVNPVECIDRKCTVLSWQNFKLVKKIVTRSKAPNFGIYYCDRMYSPKQYVTRDLSPLLFPGDPIPVTLLDRLGCDAIDVGLPRGCYGQTPFRLAPIAKVTNLLPAQGDESDAEKELDSNDVFII